MKTLIGAETAALPRCSRPGHEQWLVWKDGYKGKPPSRRQRFRCVNPDDHTDAHRFTTPVLRVAAHEHRCLGCQMLVPSHAGPVVPEGYHYLGKVIASALVDIAKGQTYSAASRSARAALAVAGGAQQVGREFSTHGQLAADWTEVFTDVVVERTTRWPSVVLLDATKFWRRQPGGKRDAFTLLFAYGYDAVEGPVPEPDLWASPTSKPVANDRLLRIGLAPTESIQTWTDFLYELPGTPLVVVADGSDAIRGAVENRWHHDVTFVRCVYHWRNNLVDHLLPDLVKLTGHEKASKSVQNHVLLALAKAAFASVDAWTRFSDEAEALPKMSLTRAWIETFDDDVLAQLHDVPDRYGPMSVGPLEKVIEQTRRQLAGRVQGLRNGPRTRLLLDLRTAGANNEANPDLWADKITDHLTRYGRRPARSQRVVAGLQMFDHRPEGPDRPPVTAAATLA